MYDSETRSKFSGKRSGRNYSKRTAGDKERIYHGSRWVRDITSRERDLKNSPAQTLVQSACN